MICKKYSEIDFELYEIVSGPHYECGNCEECYTVVSRTDWVLNTSCNCDGIISSPQCYNIPDCGIFSKTSSIDIPPNPFIPTYSPKTSPLESGKLCESNSEYNPIQVSNKIKITIPYDQIFSGIYVFDRCNNTEWKLNTLESITNINTCINAGDVNPTPKQLINFYEIDDPSSASYCYKETHSEVIIINSDFITSGDIYAFPAKYHMCLTQPASSVDGTGYRLSVGFTLPVRYRPKCQDWVVVDRLYGPNGKKTPHTIFGSPNYGYYDDPLYYTVSPPPKFKFLNSDGTQNCGSGINDLGFSFRCDGVSLGYNCQNICAYPYEDYNNETSWFKPKQPVVAQVEFVYDCRPECSCSTIFSYDEIAISNWNNYNTTCYGSSVNINYDCISNLSEQNYSGHSFEVYFLASEKHRFYIRDDINSNVYYSTPVSIGNVDKIIKYPQTLAGNTNIGNYIINWINDDISVVSTVNDEKINSVDIYWNWDITNSIFKVYILPSED